MILNSPTQLYHISLVSLSLSHSQEKRKKQKQPLNLSLILSSIWLQYVALQSMILL